MDTIDKLKKANEILLKIKRWALDDSIIPRDIVIKLIINYFEDVKMADLESCIDNLKKLVKIQSTDGNYNFDEYHFGMANGLILALATIQNEDPIYLEKPDKWINDETV